MRTWQAESLLPQDSRTSWSAFRENVLRFQADKVSPWIGLRNAVGVAIPLAVGVALRAAGGGLLGATGALNVAFSDSYVPYIQRARRMVAASVVVGFGVFSGTLCAGHPALMLVVATAWAFATGMLVALDQAAADLGTISLVTLLVFSASRMPPEQALVGAALAFCGGILQTALSVALWPLRRYAPERRALAELFRGLAASADGSTRATEPPPVTAQTTDAQDSLASLGRDHSIEAERYRALLSQAERLRLGLLVLARLRVRIAREDAGGRAAVALGRFLGLAAQLLAVVAGELTTGAAPEKEAAALQEMRALAEELRAEPGDTVRDARRQMDALSGQIRAALELVSHAVPAGAARFERREAAQSWRLRLRGTVATLRANLSLDSAACRHAIRLAVCIGVAEAAGQRLALTRLYWAPMTVAIVLKPDFSATFTRGALRLAGTFVGLLLATALFHVLPQGAGLEVVLVGLLVFVVRGFGPANYGIAATGITALVVVLVALTGMAPGSVILPRGLNTALGGGIALLAYAIWPTWERSQLPETMARMLDAYRAYFHLVRLAYERPDEPPPRELDRARLEGRRARSNAEASADRVGAEPGTGDDQARIIGGLLANSHRLAHAMMALEAGLSASPAAPPRPPFRAFADDVERTLELLAAALRGADFDQNTFPDLRDDHDALVRHGATGGRYALVNVETDRIANSLNTLTEEISRWRWRT
jgi:uncharacterized membrane protein YccC